MDSNKVVAGLEVGLENLLKTVPCEHRGILFERTLANFNSCEATRRLELAFAEEWANRNDRTRQKPILDSLLYGWESDPRREFVPVNERECQIAQLVAATVIQWLGTTIGTGFVVESFRKAGGNMTCRLPDQQ